MKNIFSKMVLVAALVATQSAMAADFALLAKAMHESTVEMIDLESANRQHVSREARGEERERIVFAEQADGELTVTRGPASVSAE